MSGLPRKRARLATSHKTWIPTAVELRDEIMLMPGVTKLSAGLIKMAGTGQLRVKVTDETGCILLAVRGNISIQDVRVYTSSIQDTKLAIARLVRNRGFKLSFK